MRIEGMEEALREINTAIEGVKEKSQAGFWEAGLKILNKAQQNLRASVVTGNLRASGYARPANGQALRPEPDKLEANQNEPIPGDRIGDLGVEVGFTAVYALNVHENLQGARTPKYLEKVVTENVDQIVAIIKARAGAE